MEERLPFYVFQEDQLSSLDGCGIVMLVRVSKCMSDFILCNVKKPFLRQNTKFNDYIPSQRGTEIAFSSSLWL